MITLLSLGIFGFWGLMMLFIAAIILVYASEHDAAFLGTATIIIIAILSQVLFGVPVWQTIVNNPFVIAAYVLGYLVIGSLYTGVWAWPDYIRSRMESINSSFRMWANHQKNAGLPESDRTFSTFVNTFDFTNVYGARCNKRKLGAWVLLWPFSLAWVLARRPAIALWNATYDLLGTTFEKIGKNTAERAHKSSQK